MYVNPWHVGPLPPGTYQWGGVVLVGQEAAGFYFADFCGDHVKILRDGWERIEPDQVAQWNNELGIPPGTPKGKGLAIV